MDTNDSPAREFDSFAANELLNERLALLDYENGIVKERESFKPLPRHYFVKSTNSGEQFFLFTNLAVWLMKVNGQMDLEYPQEFDDPNATISAILAVLKAEDIPVDYSISSIKKGSGPACLHILNELAGLALKKKAFGFQRFEVRDEDNQAENDNDEEHEENDQAEITAEQFEEDGEGSIADEDIGEATQFDTTFDEQTILAVDSGAEKRLDYLVSNDAQTPAFRAEVERATPQLKITLRADTKDWRSHMEQLSKQLNTVKTHFGVAKPFLKDVQSELTDVMQRIEARERHINSQLGSLLQQYRSVQDKIAERSEQYREASGGITARTEELASLGEEVDQLKAQIEEQGARNNDAAPLLRIKQAITKLESQIIAMNIQTAVIEQNLFNRRIRSVAASSSATLPFSSEF
uniref:Intraflagellar transport protein 57 homolog n=1 Tax=Panagrellus redivivus TaxID=6233 RepID=A0A7E4V7N9_PANRE